MNRQTFCEIEMAIRDGLDSALIEWAPDCDPALPINVPATDAWRKVLRKNIMKALASRGIIDVEAEVPDE